MTPEYPPRTANPRTEAKLALMVLGVDEAMSVKIILAIQKGNIPNVSLNYQSAR
jgi:hypothetical protein